MSTLFFRLFCAFVYRWGVALVLPSFLFVSMVRWRALGVRVRWGGLSRAGVARGPLSTRIPTHGGHSAGAPPRGLAAALANAAPLAPAPLVAPSPRTATQSVVGS